MKLAILIIALMELSLHAATYIAADCQLTNVQAAVNLATHGDTVRIPSGDCIWTNGLTISNGITVLGAGEGQTIIRDWKTGTYPRLISFVTDGHTTQFCRLSAMTIYAGTNSQAVVYIGPYGDDVTTNVFRFDNLTITNLGLRAFMVYGWNLGVIDNCTLYARSAGVTATGVSVHGDGQYGWDTRPSGFGSTNMVVIEDCTFSWYGNGNGAVDMYNAGRMAFRHNNVTNVNVGNHGLDSSGTPSAHSFEVYNNYWTNSTTGTHLYFAFRGGSGVIFSNQLESHYIYATIGITTYRAAGTNIYIGQGPCCAPLGPISGTNWIDGNVDQYGWPAAQTIGTTSPTTYYTNTTSSNGLANAFTIQGSFPLYQWSNTLKSHILGTTQLLTADIITGYTNVGEYAYIPSAWQVIQEDRDYFNNVIPSPATYTPLAYPHPLIAATEGNTFTVGTLNATTVIIGGQ